MHPKKQVKLQHPDSAAAAAAAAGLYRADKSQIRSRAKSRGNPESLGDQRGRVDDNLAILSRQVDVTGLNWANEKH